MKIILLLFANLFLWVGLSDQSAKSITGKWTLFYFHDSTANIKSFKPANYSDGQLSFKFIDDGVNGEMKGITTTNQIRGQYTLDNEKNEFENFGGTKMKEHGWGSNFWQTIKNASSYKISSDTLRIRYDTNFKEMVFYKAEIRK